MKQILVTALLLTLTLGPDTQAQEQKTSYNVVVSLRSSGERGSTQQKLDVAASRERVSRLLGGGLGRITRSYVTIPALSAVVTRGGLAALQADPAVSSVSIDEAAAVTSSKVESVARTLKVDRVGLTGNGVTIALIDSGIDSSHRDLAGAIVDEACFCVNAQGEPCCPGGASEQFGLRSAWDDNGHGTHLAGIIAGRGYVSPKGLAPSAYIVAIKIAGKDGSTTTGSMLAALDWLARSHPEVKVVNMSLGTTATYSGSCDKASAINASLAEAAVTLRGQGAVIVAAAGNSGATEMMTAPACVSGYLSVGAVYSNRDSVASSNGCTDVKTAEDRVACFSNSSSALSLLAPGAGIVSTGLGGRRATGSGTSQAAAVVSGAVALLMERAPSGGDQIEAALRTSGVSVTDQRNGRATPRLDIGAAAHALGTAH
jgi:subtilisin family serine protease